MNRGQLVEFIVKKEGLGKKQADSLVSTFIQAVQTGVKKDGEVRLVGFGTFSKTVRKARKGRNPQTGEVIKIAKKTLAKFKPSKVWDPTKAVAVKSVVKVAAKKTVVAKKATTVAKKKTAAKKTVAKKSAVAKKVTVASNKKTAAKKATVAKKTTVAKKAVVSKNSK